jgi:hypothetical protein
MATTASPVNMVALRCDVEVVLLLGRSHRDVTPRLRCNCEWSPFRPSVRVKFSFSLDARVRWRRAVAQNRK